VEYAQAGRRFYRGKKQFHGFARGISAKIRA